MRPACWSFVVEDNDDEDRTVSARFLATTSRFQSSRKRRSSSFSSVASILRAAVEVEGRGTVEAGVCTGNVGN